MAKMFPFPNDTIEISRDGLKEVCIGFFWWWYHQKGQNTYEGYDEWLKTVGAHDLIEKACTLSTNKTNVASAQSGVAMLGDVASKDCAKALQLLLDHIDYTSGACRINEPIAGCLPREILERAKQAATKAAM